MKRVVINDFDRLVPLNDGPFKNGQRTDSRDWPGDENVCPYFLCPRGRIGKDEERKVGLEKLIAADRVVLS